MSKLVPCRPHKLTLISVATAMAFVVAPFSLERHASILKLSTSAAFAKDGGGEGGDGGGGSGGGGEGGEGGGGDHSGGGSGGSGSDGSGSGGGDHSDSHDSGDHDAGGNDDGPNHDAVDDKGVDSPKAGAANVNPVTGDKVEFNGKGIEVVHADGTVEEIDKGRYEMKDAKGRTIISRAATKADRTRLLAAAP